MSMAIKVLLTVNCDPESKECGECENQGHVTPPFEQCPWTDAPVNARCPACLAAEAAHEDLRRQTIGPELMNVLARLEKAAGYKQVTAEVYWWEQLRASLAADDVTLAELESHSITVAEWLKQQMRQDVTPLTVCLLKHYPDEFERDENEGTPAVAVRLLESFADLSPVEATDDEAAA